MGHAHSRLTELNVIFQTFEAMCFEGKEVSEKRKREQFKKLVSGIVGVSIKQL